MKDYSNVTIDDYNKLSFFQKKKYWDWRKKVLAMEKNNLVTIPNKKDYYAKNKERINASKRKYRNKPEIKEKMKLYKIEYRRKKNEIKMSE